MSSPSRRAPCVVNVALGDWYPLGQQRLIRSLQKHGWPGTGLFYTALPPGSPPHSEIPYAFKLHALRKAAERHDILLWLDASVWALRALTPILDRIGRLGYAIYSGGYRAGEWMSDALLQRSRISREDAMAHPSLLSGVVGIDLGSHVGQRMFEQWSIAAGDGSFVGDWTNERGQVSSDARVRGHRHDQSALEIVAMTLGLESQPRTDVMACGDEPLGGGYGASNSQGCSSGRRAGRCARSNDNGASMR